MGTRREQKQDMSSPGPGGYDATTSLSKDRTPAYKISQSTRNDIVAKSIKDLPGPGAYN